MKPTPEQVEAAKAWMKDSCSVQQYRVIREYKPMLESLGDVSDNVSLILLAALEAAEADGARLDWLEKEAVDLSYIQRITLNETDAPLGPVFVAWGGDGNLRAVVDAARKEAQP